MATNQIHSTSQHQTGSSISLTGTPAVIEDSLKVELIDNQIAMADTYDNSNTDRFLQRMRTDLMYELRNIQHGERPVTGQSHREHLQQFMEKHMVGFNESTPTAQKGNNTPANVDSVEKHRPEAVLVEVQVVAELRPVSSILQSAAFRRHLENVVRGT
uniref:Uncharacterized protein n=1 Tax=Arion vulgaris TaxID=1028688 RepID=A0A0B7AW12_9EUPU